MTRSLQGRYNDLAPKRDLGDIRPAGSAGDKKMSSSESFSGPSPQPRKHRHHRHRRSRWERWLRRVALWVVFPIACAAILVKLILFLIAME